MTNVSFDSQKPLLLLTNDDGVAAPGLQALAAHLTGLGEILIFAPNFPRSGASHAITIADPLRLVDQDCTAAKLTRATDGTPADAVKLGLALLAPIKPHLAISGINLGANTGVFIHYSGTVSAAREACLNGVPALAVSLATYQNPIFSSATAWASKIARWMLKIKWQKIPLLNLNVPNLPLSEIKGLKLTRQGNSILRDHYDERVDPRNGRYFWLVDDAPILDQNEDSDEKAIQAGYCSLTPIKWDLTDYDSLETLHQTSFLTSDKLNE